MTPTDRREFLVRSGLLAGGAALMRRLHCTQADALAKHDLAADARISFQSTDRSLQSHYQGALDVLVGNVQLLPAYPKPVLVEGSVYRGVWLECAPNEA